MTKEHFVIIAGVIAQIKDKHFKIMITQMFVEKLAQKYPKFNSNKFYLHCNK